MRFITAFFIAALSAGAWGPFSASADSGRPGSIAPQDPIQVDRADLPAFSLAGYRILPAAEFSVQARVLSAEHYRSGREADLSPVDLALGWGPMSDSTVLNHLQISQAHRFYFYRWSNPPPIPPSAIVEHSANMHMIPASDDIKRRLQQVRAGQVVTLSGYLVRIEAADGWHWNSSMTRADSGAGACEVVWVRSFTAADAPVAPSVMAASTPVTRAVR